MKYKPTLYCCTATKWHLQPHCINPTPPSVPYFKTADVNLEGSCGISTILQDISWEKAWYRNSNLFGPLFSVIPNFDFPVGAARQEDVRMERIPFDAVNRSQMCCDRSPVKDFTFGADGPQLTLIGADENHRLIRMERHAAERCCIMNQTRMSWNLALKSLLNSVLLDSDWKSSLLDSSCWLMSPWKGIVINSVG